MCPENIFFGGGGGGREGESDKFNVVSLEYANRGSFLKLWANIIPDLYTMGIEATHIPVCFTINFTKNIR